MLEHYVSGYKYKTVSNKWYKGILQTITKYVFQEKEEEYITRIVEIIQNNDLENKKENIRAQISQAIDSEKIKITQIDEMIYIRKDSFNTV